MEIFPAIDLQDGKCVRLTQGDFNAATVYDANPLRIAGEFAEAGARWLHVVDLDGARDGQSRQFDLIARIAHETTLELQVGGGIREAETIEGLMNAGAARVVIGSLAVKNRPLVEEWLNHFSPAHIVLAFDVRLDSKGEPEVMTHGWQSGSGQSLWQLLDHYMEHDIKTILCTDVSRDGMLSGANHKLYGSIQMRYPGLDILASGGVDGLRDLLDLSKLGLKGAIVGKAIYEARIDLAIAIKQLKDAG